MPLRYEATWWSIVFPLGMCAVARISLGEAGRLPVVEMIGSLELSVAFAVWMLVLVAMMRHVRQTTFARRRESVTADHYDPPHTRPEPV